MVEGAMVTVEGEICSNIWVQLEEAETCSSTLAKEGVVTCSSIWVHLAEVAMVEAGTGNSKWVWEAVETCSSKWVLVVVEICSSKWVLVAVETCSSKWVLVVAEICSMGVGGGGDL
ncbi:hypothetical protein AMTR_s00066p00033460 [Amborella trichopoda]|uniref:Uncharacterized protein n=1 Tax=Amborella trichopoda TaxID=13333 RepID=U5DC55_AMBTC|nr:hypothetical protein AMTR_s00066p00033460 [Amborella trichopoda]